MTHYDYGYEFSSGAEGTAWRLTVRREDCAVTFELTVHGGDLVITAPRPVVYVAVRATNAAVIAHALEDAFYDAAVPRRLPVALRDGFAHVLAEAARHHRSAA